MEGILSEHREVQRAHTEALATQEQRRREERKEGEEREGFRKENEQYISSIVQKSAQEIAETEVARVQNQIKKPPIRVLTQPWKVIRFSENEVDKLEFAGSGNRLLATGGIAVRVYDTETWSEILLNEQSFASMLYKDQQRDLPRIIQEGIFFKDGSLSPDGKYFVSKSEFITLLADETWGNYSVWDISAGTATLSCAMPIAELHALQNMTWIDSAPMLWSPEGRHLFTFGDDFRIFRRRAFYGMEVRDEAGELWSNKGEEEGGLRICSFDQKITGKSLIRLWWRDDAGFDHDDWLLDATIAPNGRYLVTLCKANGGRVWDARTGRLVATLKLPGKHTDWEYETFHAKVMFVPNKRILLTRQRKSHSRDRMPIWALWNTDSWSLIETWELPLGDDGERFNDTEVAMSPDGSAFAGLAKGGDSEDYVVIWDFPERTPRLKIRTLRPEQLYFTSDGKHLVTGPRFADADDDYLNNVNLWDVETGELKYRITDRHTTASSISPDCSILVTGNNTGDISIWRLSDAEVSPYRSEYPISGITQSQLSELRQGMLFRQIRNSLGNPDESKTIEVDVEDKSGEVRKVKMGVCIYYADLSTGANAVLILQGGTYGSLIAKHSVGL